MNVRTADTAAFEDDEDEAGISLLQVGRVLWAQKLLIVGVALLAGALGYGGSFLVRPTFTARTLILPPQQGQSSMAAALGSLGALAGLAGGGGGLKSPADQYIALMQSVTVADKLIDRFKLLDEYEAKYRVNARKILEKNTSILAGKKDGLITIEVDDHDPKRAAEMANAYVDGLRDITNTLAVSEAQQRRAFFEQKLSDAKKQLTQAQIALQASGFNAGALQAEPRAAAEAYARIRAEYTAAQVRLQTMRRSLADNAPELLQQQALLGALRGELAKMEQKGQGESTASGGGPDYITRYREFKYQETLFDLFAKQYELARVDESREGGLIQVVDPATPPELKSKPKRSVVAAGAAVLAGLLLCIGLLYRARDTLILPSPNAA